MRAPLARVRVRLPDGEVGEGSFTGDGPVDAFFSAINAAVGRDARLKEFHVTAVTGGRDALGEVDRPARARRPHRLRRRASRPTSSRRPARPTCARSRTCCATRPVAEAEHVLDARGARRRPRRTGRARPILHLARRRAADPLRRRARSPRRRRCSPSAASTATSLLTTERGAGGGAGARGRRRQRSSTSRPARSTRSPRRCSTQVGEPAAGGARRRPGGRHREGARRRATGCAARRVPTTLSGAELTPFHRMPEGVEGARMVRPALVIADPALMASQPPRRSWPPAR